MIYAIRNDGLGWRAVNDESDVGEGEHLSLEPPAPVEIVEKLADVERAKGRIALLRAGRLDELEEFIDKARASDDLQVREVAIVYDNAAMWSRYSPTTAALQSVLNLTDEETDQLFRDAAAIEY